VLDCTGKWYLLWSSSGWMLFFSSLHSSSLIYVVVFSFTMLLGVCWLVLVCSLLTYLERKCLGSVHRRVGSGLLG